MSAASLPQLPLPPLSLVTGSGEFSVGADGVLTVESPAGLDLVTDPVSGAVITGAPLVGFEAPSGDFTLSARVVVPGQRSTYDAGVLALYSDAEHWAKLCFEFSPDAESMAVGVVTRGYSDDSNGDVVRGDALHLRVARVGEAFAFHHSADGRRWRFLRVFRLDTPAPLRLGFLAQSPFGEGRVARFEDIRLTARTLTDLRDGS